MQEWETEIASYRNDVINHALFRKVTGAREIGIFMSNHVFAVWDFMSLLKTLQNQLTCTSVPWFPPEHPEAARLINEIVLGEETDEAEPGIVLSHFELYRKAMRQAGASSEAIDEMLARLRAGTKLTESFTGLDIAPNVATFVRTTLATCAKGPHEVAAAFFYGREDVIPDMFTRALAAEGLQNTPQFSLLKLYMRRHIELDGDSHGPRARRILELLCGVDPRKWSEARSAARQSLLARKLLWDGVLYAVDKEPGMPELPGLEKEFVR